MKIVRYLSTYQTESFVNLCFVTILIEIYSVGVFSVVIINIKIREKERKNYLSHFPSYCAGKLSNMD